jgi:hypothetical protein
MVHMKVSRLWGMQLLILWIHDSDVEDIPVVVDYMLDMGQDSGSEVECDDLEENSINWFGESSESESECSAHNDVPPMVIPSDVSYMQKFWMIVIVR